MISYKIAPLPNRFLTLIMQCPVTFCLSKPGYVSKEFMRYFEYKLYQ